MNLPVVAVGHMQLAGPFRPHAAAHCDPLVRPRFVGLPPLQIGELVDTPCAVAIGVTEIDPQQGLLGNSFRVGALARPPSR
jgi:hypothetical protein